MNSITHILESILQYVALIIALLLYRWARDVASFSGSSLSKRHVLKGRGTHPLIHSELLMLYQWIKQYRQQHGLTQEEMSEKLEVDIRTLQRWESGETRPQPRHYSKFQSVLYDKLYDEPHRPRVKIETTPRPMRYGAGKNVARGSLHRHGRNQISRRMWVLVRLINLALIGLALIGIVILIIIWLIH